MTYICHTFANPMNIQKAFAENIIIIKKKLSIKVQFPYIFIDP